MTNEKHDKKPETHVDVLITTTSGNYPDTGRDRVPVNQPVRQQLQAAAKKLDIVDTTGWVAMVNGELIDPAKSYAENNLTGNVTIDYGRSEGGGGVE